MNAVKAAAFDLDDTLLRDDLTISAETVRIFRQLRDQGFVFVAASGRTLMSMKPFVDALGCVSLCIGANGALIWDPADGRVLHRETFSVDLCHEIARFGNEFGCYQQTYSDDRFYFNEVSDYSRRYAAMASLPGECVGDLAQFIREPRSKILMMSDEDTVARMLALGQQRFAGRASVTCSKPYFLEFNPLRATKGIALEKTAALLGLKPENFAVFGDSLNDLPMLRIAGLSVAVANARPEVIAGCNQVCLSNNEDGVARFLKQYLAEVPQQEVQA